MTLQGKVEGHKPSAEALTTELLTMLTYKRPAGSNAERAFIKWYIEPLGALPDEYGNYWLTIGDSPILWSCHTDTVHKTSGKQTVLYGDDIATTTSGECLGADCTTGVWLMRNMAIEGVPGTYVFHRDEEIGGLGSRYVAHHCKPRLAGIHYAIAFDRKGTHEVITHQGGRTCSDAFAVSLAEALQPLRYQPSDRGVFTDTANYESIIPECTNIGVGYYRQHNSNECQDVAFALALLGVLLEADFSGLVCKRDPEAWDDWWTQDNKPENDPADWRQTPMRQYVYDNPDVVATFLESCGFKLDDLREFERDTF